MKTNQQTVTTRPPGLNRVMTVGSRIIRSGHTIMVSTDERDAILSYLMRIDKEAYSRVVCTPVKFSSLHYMTCGGAFDARYARRS